jgi:hypothetical protein
MLVFFGISQKLQLRLAARVSSKQTKFFFGSNRNKPKLNLFRFIFVLFRETNNKFFRLFRFVSVFRTRFETTETNRSVSKQTEKNEKTKNEPKQIEFRFVSVWTEKKIFCFEDTLQFNEKTKGRDSPDPWIFLLTEETSLEYKNIVFRKPWRNRGQKQIVYETA